MSQVADYYVGRSILVTGAYGFMGKVLLEKLLYACPGIKNVFILVRPKRGRSIELRLEDMLKIPLFERIRNESPEAFKKIIPVQADMSLDDLGLHDDSIKQLEDVSIIFHAAASLRLDAKLKAAVKMNLEGTHRFLEICKGFKKLEAFVYVSTAFCHCEYQELEERIYKSTVLPADIIRLCQWMDDDALQLITPSLLGVHPNAYTYTKRLAEALVDSYFPQLPVVVARPSIVTPAWFDPMEGWVDNLNGPVGLIVGGGKGVIRSMLCNADYHAEVIPVDVAINGLISIPWKLGATTTLKPYAEFTETPVFNLTQSGTQPITWGEIVEIGKKVTHENPFQVMLWYPNGTIRTNRMVHNIYVILFHWLPAYIIDFLLLLFGKKTFMLNVQRRIQDGLDVLQYFTMREWIFKNDRLIDLRESMNRVDRQLFTLDFEKIEAVAYIATCVLGSRHYLLKEDPASLPRSRKIIKIFYVLDIATSALFYVLVAWLLVSCSDSARYLLDSASDLLFTMPILRNLK